MRMRIPDSRCVPLLTVSILFFVAATQGFTIRRFKPGFGSNCTGSACLGGAASPGELQGLFGGGLAVRRPSHEDIKKLVLQGIQEKVLFKLGMDRAPRINATQAVPHEVYQKALQELKTTDRHKIPVNSNLAQVSEIISFAEAGNSSDNNVIYFTVSGQYQDANLEVKAAELFVLLRYKRPPGGQKRYPRRITLKVYHMYSDEVFEHTGKDRELIETHDLTISHTTWQKITVPKSLVQPMFNSHFNDLRLFIHCSDCPNFIQPILAKKMSKGRRKRDRLLKRVKRVRSVSRLPLPDFQVHKRKNLNKRRPFLIIRTEQKHSSFSDFFRAGKKRRSTECDPKSDCCKKHLYVDFSELGWDWILAPPGYQANYCQGNCGLSPSPSRFIHHHSFVVRGYKSKNAHITPCCSPKKMSTLSILYLNENGEIVQSDIPKMIIDECGCA
ncbi:inhibin beta B chain [Lingula anatina]|uniref:Inhibin beta B chain n=1 Tax=Lingula anatina TaxID=7574 RepID=A0A1S3HP02_LINAN|nr:inhibin beta B chain [Lingula anatina]|eukprot:XP_013387783.1 inhibin beta B chain [Lingula anatina]